MSSNRYFRLITFLFLFASVLCGDIDGSDDDFPNGDPPASYFSAAPTMPVAALQSAASRLARTSHGGSFRLSSDSGERSSIYSDWALFNEGAAVVWTADMDVDCDGIDYGCKGNPDGRPETSWGALSAYEVPFIVIPEEYLDKHEAGLRGNNIVAVICNGNMFYGILGDTNGDSPEVTGEASWLMARTCFPTEGLNGARGHNDPNVTYIVFLGDDAVLPASAMNHKYITDFDTLRAMGDELVNALVSNIGLGSGDGAGTQTRFRHPLFKAVDAATGTRRTASILTARSWNTTSGLSEPSIASCSPASGNSTTPCKASASTPATSFPGISPPSTANPLSQAASNTATPVAGSIPSASLHEGAASPPSVASPSSAATSAAATSSAPPPPTPTPSCSWPGHCLGALCSTLDDCSNDLVCVNGLCAVDQDVALVSTSSPTGTPAVRRWITAVRGVKFDD
ncbi:fungal chitosanase of glycosyl hydrolase group 75-domain-containing protein [Aspergillus foveolatus]|uniref:fungal chitosanase of glycosyl hydrolase group 75-domain-containing protein n=1 Tax=Aspergillus foveolatus TaxID=210207 RepID=UPI003CCE4081